MNNEQMFKIMSIFVYDYLYDNGATYQIKRNTPI